MTLNLEQVYFLNQAKKKLNSFAVPEVQHLPFKGNLHIIAFQKWINSHLLIFIKQTMQPICENSITCLGCYKLFL